MTDEPIAVRVEPPDADAAAVATVERIARAAFPTAARVEWSDDVDEVGDPYKLMSVVGPGTAEEIHEAYLAFMRAWVREAPPERRRRIRVAYRSGMRD